MGKSEETPEAVSKFMRSAVLLQQVYAIANRMSVRLPFASW